MDAWRKEEGDGYRVGGWIERMDFGKKEVLGVVRAMSWASTK